MQIDEGMIELLRIENLNILHIIVVICVAVECFNFTDKNIFRDFGKIIVTLTEGNMSLQELYKRKLTGKGGETFSFGRLMKAYVALDLLKAICAAMLVTSMIQCLLIFFGHVVKDIIPISSFVSVIWYVLYSLDLIILFVRGRSKIAHILHDLHPNYCETRVLFIIIWAYIVKK